MTLAYGSTSDPAVTNEHHYQARPTDVDWAALRKPFEKNVITKVNKGFGMVDTINHAVVTDRLLKVAPTFTYGIDRFIEATGKDGQPHLLAVWGWMQIGGIRRYEVGEVERPSTYGDELKKAASDFLKRAAMRFGVGLDLWSKEDLSVPGEVELPPSSPGARASEGPDGSAGGVPGPSGATTTPERGEKQAGSGDSASKWEEPVGPSGSADDLAGDTLSELMDLGVKLANNSKNQFRKWVNDANGTSYKVPDFEQNVSHEELENAVRRLQAMAEGKLP